MSQPSVTTISPTYLHKHAVQFYADDASLFTTVATFLAEGLAAGQPAVVIATTDHRASIIAYLCDRLIDCDRAIKEGALIILDAHETLDRFMIGGRPDANLFESSVGSVIAGMLEGRPQPVVRAYGEMVDVLWKDGQRDAAIQLETLWNSLAARYNFALLCGYAMGNFYKQAQHFDEVCAQHTHASMPDGKVIAFKTA
jgi:hypothetical protein